MYIFGCRELRLEAIAKPTDADDVLFELLSDDGKTVSLRKFWDVCSIAIYNANRYLCKLDTLFLCIQKCHHI